MDPHNRSDVRRAREQAKADAREQDEFLRQMLAVRHGRKFFWNLLADCRIGQNPFSTDPAQMAFACGEMNVGQRLLAEIIRVAPERYVEMMREQNDRRTDTDDASAGTSADAGADSDTGDTSGT